MDRGVRTEQAAQKWSRALKPSTGSLVLPLLKILERRGGAARPAEIYDELAEAVGLDPETRGIERTFANGRISNLWERRVRFAREDGKRQGLIASPERGLWALTDEGAETLGLVKPGLVINVFETANGRALWARAEEAVGAIPPESVDLVFTSPPYPLLTDKRRYGSMDVVEWLSWMTDLAGAWRDLLTDTGSLIVNLCPVNVSGFPCQSPYIERFTLAMVDALGYWLADRLYWENPNRMPPMEWVAVRRMRTRPTVEPVLWFSKKPFPKADNRRVLVPYKDPDSWMGREKAAVRPSGFDCSETSFSRDNGGRIPGTLVSVPVAQSNDAWRRRCRAAGLPLHPAVMPAAVAEYAIQLTTDTGDTVYDPFLGSGTTARVAEDLGRRWIGSERSLAFLEGAALRF